MPATTPPPIFAPINSTNNTISTAGSILRASGFYSTFGEAIRSGAIPEFLSSAKWSNEAQGVPQQTFLGASIRSFNMQGGFGDSSSTLNVDLVVDEFNTSDGTTEGFGDDIYHSGKYDKFVPPMPGSPVFFKFGPNYATIEQAYRKTFDELYYYDTIGTFTEPTTGSTLTVDQIFQGGVNIGANQYIRLPEKQQITYNSRSNNLQKGKDHITFGGILQTYTQHRSSAGNPLYTVGVVDPREILSNVTLILNNYAGSTYGQSNILNIYGFLEFNTSYAGLGFKNTVRKNVDNNGNITFSGDDNWYQLHSPDFTAERLAIKNAENAIAEAKRNTNIPPTIDILTPLYNTLKDAKTTLRNAQTNAGPSFPITGTGFSRRGPQGMPYYRIRDAVNALMEYKMPLPTEYQDQGFGGRINFRGFNYIVDLSGLPELPEFYYFDFDQINLLELALEICDITNRDLFVSLLPVINHPACATIYSYNNTVNNNRDLVAGIIRLDTIDRSEQPFYGAVKSYIDSLSRVGIYVENQDLGYELSNISTDKFIVGAQEVDTYFFSTNADRDMIAARQGGETGNGYQWKLETSLEQQVLPYYGKLGNHAVTIPKGFGAYQQILLDSSSLNAAGVGLYYVATEMELRCALISFDRWKEFLLQYNDVYMESVESDDGAQAFSAGMTPNPDSGSNPPVSPISSSYVVTVPRSVFDSYVTGPLYNVQGLPSSACNPPYGYPLYYKRATQIGIPEGGLTNLFNKWVTLNTNLAELSNADPKDIKGILNSQYQRLKNVSPLTAFEQQYLQTLESIMQNPTPKAIQQSIGFLENAARGNGKKMFAILPSIAKKNNKNAIRVYEFVKGVAEECLGKKFLVKIPQKVNLSYKNEITLGSNCYNQGPFGFRPRSTKNIPGYEFTERFRSESEMGASDSMMISFLSSGVQNIPSVVGALRVNFNPMSEKYESNYSPMNIGGYFPFDLYQNTLGASTIANMSASNFNSLPSGVSQGLIPQDLTNFINEDGRVSAYVRFDHSEDLTLEGLNDSDFTQQYIVGNYMIPDLVGALDNTGPDEFTSFPNIQSPSSPNRPSQVAFVKCSVDENLYFPPKTYSRSISVHGQSVVDIGTKSIPNKIFVPCSGVSGGRFVPGTGVLVDSFSYYKANYVPAPSPGTDSTILDFQTIIVTSPGGNSSKYIDTSLDSLDTGHAYALITLPNRIIPNKDSRFRDGQYQSMNAELFKHLMTMDTVRGLPGFNAPRSPQKAPTGNLNPPGMNVPIDTSIKAWFAMKKVHQQMSFGLPFQINATMPSPVYPDLVALPLMSNDRCYGPWVSSQLDGQAYVISNIGGKVDFIKDENLNPWNYGGYYMMNEAGRSQAEFSNSLLLFSERGSFTIPDVPRSSSLCRALTNGGPLVTSINVDISPNGARTTYQMDLYTPSFGKLHKQKQEEISKISRERKRINSERNALIRKGLGKNQSARNFANEYNMMNNGVMPSLNQLNLGMANAMTSLIASVSAENSQSWSSSAGNISSRDYSTGGSLQSANQMGTAAQLFPDQLSMAGNYGNSAERPLFGSQEDDPLLAPVSNGFHGNMAYRPNNDIDAKSDLYFIDKTDLENDWSNQTTKWGDTA